MPHYTDLLARACQIAGQIEEASNLFDDALQIVQRTGERWLEAELNRHKGQLLLQQGHTDAAEELYREALKARRSDSGRDRPRGPQSPLSSPLVAYELSVCMR